MEREDTPQTVHPLMRLNTLYTAYASAAMAAFKREDYIEEYEKYHEEYERVKAAGVEFHFVTVGAGGYYQLGAWRGPYTLEESPV